MTKRFFDLLCSVLLLMFLTPIFFGVIAAIYFSMGKPIFFKQKRIGLNENEFEIIKFRTMRPPEKNEQMLLTDAVRVTKVGNFLRRTSLDELPELWNIIKGDMSLVGPRPLLDAHLKVFTSKQRMRHTVRPGLTGLAQVSGRQSLTFGQRTALDIDYVNSQSLWGDIKILFRTIGIVLGGTGVETGQMFGEVDDVGLKSIIDSMDKEKSNNND